MKRPDGFQSLKKEDIMNVFQEMALSVYSYGSYKEFLKNKKGKVIGFAVLLMTIYFGITMLLPSLIGPNSFPESMKILRDDVPDFRLEGGRLWVDGRMELDNGLAYFYIDTDPDHIVEYSSELARDYRLYADVMIMDSEKVIMKNNGTWETTYFSDMKIDVDKKDVVNFIPWLYVIYAVFMGVAYIWMTGWFFFGVLIVALIGMIIAAAMNYRISFGKLYLMGVYSRTLPLLIKALVSFLPFGIPFFGVFNFGLSALILGLALKKMKDQIPQAPQMPMGYPPQGYNM